MFNHAKKDYVCPICVGISGVESEDTLMRQADIVYTDDLVTAFINSFFVGENRGHVIVVPNKHFENVYDLPDEVGHRIFEVYKKISIAMRKAYSCDGITTRQNNEPAGDQHAFHYHFHVFPRYNGDSYNKNSGEKYLADPEERKEYAEKLKKFL